MAGVTFSKDAAKRIADVVRRAERTPQDRTAGPIKPHPTETWFWAMITGCDLIGGLHYRFVRVIPNASADHADLTLGNGAAYRLALSGEDAETGWAREANGARGVTTFTVVLMNFIGYDADGEPAYLFAAPPVPPDQFIPPHDHRDNYNGGFAFATYHPGTSLPQQRWAL